jgi:hypothetical protein
MFRGPDKGLVAMDHKKVFFVNWTVGEYTRVVLNSDIGLIRY